MNWKRTRRYLALRIVRLSAAPEPLARAIACGISVSFFPVFGVHALMGVAMAFIMRANIVAAALATILIPPFILPLIFSLDYLVGHEILRYLGVSLEETGGRQAIMPNKAAAGTHYLLDDFTNLFLPAMIGSLVFMVLVWPAAYLGSRKLIAAIARRHDQARAQRLGEPCT